MRAASAPRRRRRHRVRRRPRVGESARHDASAGAADPALRAVRHARALRLARSRRSRTTRALGVVRGDRRDARRCRSTGDLRWHDGTPTTARDVAFTLDAARDPATGFPRAAELAVARHRAAPSTTRRSCCASRTPQPDLPPHPLRAADRARAPARARAARATATRAVQRLAPVGQRSVPVRAPRRRAALDRSSAMTTFPAALGGRPRCGELVVAVVDEATTKFAGLVSGELDVAGISPTMAALAARDPTLARADYPVLFAHGARASTRTRPPFDDVRVRRAVDRVASTAQRIVDVALAGFGTPASGPVPPGQSARAATPRRRTTPRAPTRCSTPPGGGAAADGGARATGRALAVELLTVGSGDNAVEQLVQADLAARGIRRRDPTARDGRLPHDGARASAKRFDVLIAGIPGDLSLAYLARDVRLALARRRARLHRLPHAAPRRALRARRARRHATRSVATRGARVQRELAARDAGRVDLPRARRAGRLASAARRDDGPARRAGDADALVAAPAASARVTLLLDAARAAPSAGASRAARWRRSPMSLRAELAPLSPRARDHVPPREGAALARRRALPAATARCSSSIRARRAAIAARVRRDVPRRAHHRWWIMWYQLWLAERARPRRAALRSLRGDARHATLARAHPRRLRRALPRLSRTATTSSARRDCSSAPISSRSGCCRSASRSTCSRRRAHVGTRGATRARSHRRAERAR